MAQEPEAYMDFTDLPLPSKSNLLKEAQDTAPSTSITPVAEPQRVSAPKTKAQKQREYRQRLAALRTPAQATAARISDAERQRNYRLRKANTPLDRNTLESSPSFSSRSRTRSNDTQTGTRHHLTHKQRQTSAGETAQIIVQPGSSSDQFKLQQAQSSWNTKWASTIMRFKSTFLDNDFGYACSVCDRLWFKNDLKPITQAQLEVISEWFIKENRALDRDEYQMVCNTCKRTLNKKLMPLLAKVNGFSYPDRPGDLPQLDPMSERLISPRLPFMQVRRLRRVISNGMVEQVINVPVNEQEIEKCLPRHLNEDDVINVNIKRNLAHKSNDISGLVSEGTVSAWLSVLQKSTLYRLYRINVDLSRLHPAASCLEDVQECPSNCIENISGTSTHESEILVSRQHTMLWSEEDCLNSAPRNQAIPLINDRHAEELSFPSIYFGEPRRFKKGISVTPHMIVTSEIRRRDRRGATPQKILYVAMKILRLRMVDGIDNTFRNVSTTENVTRRMLEDTEFLKKYVIQNLAFKKTVPNSVHYWASGKRDLFAMIRQLGKPTVFLTITANEIRWMKLLTILLKLSKKYPGKTAKDLNTFERCTLVSDDPVTCCIYFYKLVGSLMKMLKSKQYYNPFGNYFVKDYFLRIEFQQHGSPNAHILLWLNDDPRETVSENMPRTIDLVEKISSVARDDVPNNSIYANQIHKHTFACIKRGETICRFRNPYWPMPTTRVLIPIPQTDGRQQKLQQKAKDLRTSLIERQYACMDEFLNDNGLTYDLYLDIVRSTLRRPTLVFRRNFDELVTNTFNPYLAGEVHSNIDIQFILDDYSCAEYVVEYVNKSARAMSNLRCELITMMQKHPNQDYTGLLNALGIKLLNSVEMSAQEAAWYLLRQPRSETSRQVVYIPTVWPTERSRCRKRRQQMDREGIDGDSTDVWTKNLIQRYEERPASLDQVYLAEFAAWYANANDIVDEEDDVHLNDDEGSEAVPEVKPSSTPKEYRRRLLGRIIRYTHYDMDDIDNYKREMVLLYVQFRNEMSEIVDQNKFLQLFDDNKDTIMERRSLFETNLNIGNVMKEVELTMTLENDDNSNLQEEESKVAFVHLLGEGGAENVDDVNQIVPGQEFSFEKKCNNVTTNQLYCDLKGTTYPEQQKIFIDVINRLHDCGDDVSEALQIFFTCSAGFGKSYTLKSLLETYNRYAEEHNSLNNDYIAGAIVEAAVPLDETTVNSAFRLTSSLLIKFLSTENLRDFRNMFADIKAIFVEDISMISSAILQKMNYRLQQITAIYDKPFGGIQVIVCGETRQLSPVLDPLDILMKQNESVKQTAETSTQAKVNVLDMKDDHDGYIADNPDGDDDDEHDPEEISPEDIVMVELGEEPDVDEEVYLVSDTELQTSAADEVVVEKVLTEKRKLDDAAEELEEESDPKKKREEKLEKEDDNSEEVSNNEARDVAFKVEVEDKQDDTSQENEDEENNSEELEDAGTTVLIQEIDPTKICIQCKIEKDCIYHLPNNNDSEAYICSEDCLKSYLMEYPTQAPVADSKYVVEEISPQLLTCTQCEEHKVCYFYYKLDREDTYYCSINCLHNMMADERGKFDIKRRKIVLNDIQLKKVCFVCHDKKKCLFSMIRYGLMHWICDQICVKNLNDAENGRYVLVKKCSTAIIKRTNKSLKNPSLSKLKVRKNATDKYLDEGHKIQTKSSEMIEAAKEERQLTFVRSCTQCNLMLTSEDRMLTWETMDFCNEVCLGRYQNKIGARCAYCNKAVQHTSLGKYCVRLGTEIRQFCDSSCLEEFQKTLKICCYCQNDISTDVQGFLMPVDDKGQFKDFCSQFCMEKYDLMRKNQISKPVWAKCAVCAQRHATIFEVEVGEGVSQRLCSDACFAAFKFVNDIYPDQCCWCKKYFERKVSKSFTMYEKSGPQCFCTKICMNVYIRESRHVVPCAGCKVKKYNYDLIRCVQMNGETVLMCSLKCLSFNEISVNAVSSRRTKCDMCKLTSLARYHLTMTDATLRNFCTYRCVTSFQKQYSKRRVLQGSKLVAEETLDQATAVPTGSPIRAYPKYVQRNSPTLPVISNIQSLASPQSEDSSASNACSKTKCNALQTPPVEQDPALRTPPPPPPKSSNPPLPSPPKIYNHVVVKTLTANDVANKATMTKPMMVSKEVSCCPHLCTKESQTDSSLERKILIPIPVPIYVPAPCAMWSLPFPIPVPIPLPIPTPLLIPTTSKSSEDIIKNFDKIQEYDDDGGNGGC